MASEVLWLHRPGPGVAHAVPGGVLARERKGLCGVSLPGPAYTADEGSQRCRRCVRYIEQRSAVPAGEGDTDG